MADLSLLETILDCKDRKARPPSPSKHSLALHRLSVKIAVKSQHSLHRLSPDLRPHHSPSLILPSRHTLVMIPQRVHLKTLLAELRALDIGIELINRIPSLILALRTCKETGRAASSERPGIDRVVFARDVLEAFRVASLGDQA